MLMIDDQRIREKLRRIVSRLSSEEWLREDLLQEGLIHLWLSEERHPGQTESWYLQGCQYHLKNYLNAGKSVDSFKRRRGRLCSDSDSENFDVLVPEEKQNGTLDSVSARDILSELMTRLQDTDADILQHLAEGLGAREIARRMRVSHPAIVKRRRKIARLAVELGLRPMSAPLTWQQVV